MSGDLSPRAQAILAEIERVAGEPRPPDAMPAPGGDPAPLRQRPPEPPPAVAEPQAPEADLARALHDDVELSRLVDDVIAQAERARLGLAALSAAVEDIANRLGAPPAPSLPPEPAPLPSASVGPEDTSWMAQASKIESVRADAAPAPPRPVVPDTLPWPAAPTAPPPAAPGRVNAPPPPPPRATRGAARGPAARPRRESTHDAPSPAPDGAQPSAAVHASARLVALEMAVSGLSREEVGQRLRSLYDVEDPGSTLDLVFGAGTPGDSRVRLD